MVITSAAAVWTIISHIVSTSPLSYGAVSVFLSCHLCMFSLVSESMLNSKISQITPTASEKQNANMVINKILSFGTLLLIKRNPSENPIMVNNAPLEPCSTLLNHGKSSKKVKICPKITQRVINKKTYI